MPKDNIIQSPFKPRARMLLQLGDQLIKNESVALIELVKNSYDADATCVDIILSNIDNKKNGQIIIKDNGWGMDLDTIINCWLEPGSDSKSKIVNEGKRSPKGRLPIGEKGIGRFGVHKLGSTIELITKKFEGKEYVVRINWNDFSHSKYLDDVPVSVIERDKPEIFIGDEHGTLIRINDLNKSWTRGEVRSIKRTINSLSSPFESNDGFEANLICIGHEDWLNDMIDWKDIKKYAMYHFKATLVGDSISFFEYDFLPWDSMPKISSYSIKWDSSLEKEKLDNIKLKYISESQYFEYGGKDFSLDEDDTEIGKVKFEGYIFDRDSFVLKLGVSDKQGFKEYLDSNGGIRIYRDGLRVYDYGEVGNDWLNLDIRRVNQPGKKISNNIILGAISLDRETSKSLIEKTNREGFVENKAYTLFRNSILHVLNIVETLRFEDKSLIRELYGPTAKSEPVLNIIGDLKKFVDEKIREVPIRNHINKYLLKIEADYKVVCDNLLKAAGAGLNMSVIVHEVEKIIAEVSLVLKKEKASDRAIHLVEHLSSLIDGYAEIIRKSDKKTENVIKIIDNSLFNTEYRLRAHGVQVDRSYQEYSGSTKIKASRSLLIGAIMNVIDNSIYWLEKSKRLDKKIYVGLYEDDSYINIIFADNGVGFLLPTDSITQPFVSAKQDGIGLGLHIANEVLLAQNGLIRFPDYDDLAIPADYKNGAIIVFSLKK